MEFKQFHKDFFNALTGAYSSVTDREHYDSQITLTDNEASIVINHFGRENIHIGNVNSDTEKSLKEFKLYGSQPLQMSSVKLNLVFPKPNKTELRLYLSEKRGYKPNGGDIWFIYIDINEELYIGFLEEREWNSLGQTDVEDDFYLSEIETINSKPTKFDISPFGKISQSSISGRVIFQRDPRLAVNRFIEADFKCEIDSFHNTFIAEKTKLPFMEAHHFIPMKFQ
ncbi:MAG: hypothetical protein IPH88_03860 [Bacteroidales bacterium]|nr:hypothetical protein [Bacteroidales bacterium]